MLLLLKRFFLQIQKKSTHYLTPISLTSRRVRSRCRIFRFHFRIKPPVNGVWSSGLVSDFNRHLVFERHVNFLEWRVAAAVDHCPAQMQRETPRGSAQSLHVISQRDLSLGRGIIISGILFPGISFGRKQLWNCILGSFGCCVLPYDFWCTTVAVLYGVDNNANTGWFTDSRFRRTGYILKIYILGFLTKFSGIDVDYFHRDWYSGNTWSWRHLSFFKM